MFPQFKVCWEKWVQAMHVAVAHPNMRPAFLPALNINVFVRSSRNKSPKEALGPCLSALQLFPGWLLFLAGQDGQLHGKAAARTGSSCWKGSATLRHASCVCWNETLWGILVISNPWEAAEAGRRERKETWKWERMNVWKKWREKLQPLFTMVQTLVLKA